MRTLSLILALAVFSSSNLFGQTFFWSDLAFGEGAVVDTDFQTNAEIGDSNTLYLFYRADSVDIGLPHGGIDFDFGWSQDGIAEFTNARTIDFQVFLPSNPTLAFGPRWGDFAGAASNVTENDVDGFLAVNVFDGEGLRHGNACCKTQ